MAETIRELVVKYGIDVDSDPLDKLDSAINSLTGGLLGIGASLSAAAAGLFGVVKSAANAGDEVFKMSQRVGVGVESLQTLMFQAKLADVGVEQLQMSLTFLNRNMAEAGEKGGEAAKAFMKVGISQAELRSGALSADKAMERIGKTFARLPNGPQKTALAMEIFGRSGAQIIPLLNNMAHGLTETQKAILQMNMMTEEQAKLGEEFNDNLHVLQAALGGIVKKVGIALIPAMNELVQSFTAFIVENKELIKTNVGDFVQGLAEFLKTAGRWAMIVAKSISAMARAVGGAGNLVQILLTAMFALSGMSVLRGMGMLVTATMAFVKALTLAKVVAFAIPALIGAAILLVILVIDDLVAFFQGRDSVTAVIIEKFKEVWQWFQNTFPNIAKLVKGVFDFIAADVQMIVGLFSWWFGIVAKLGKYLMTVLMPIFDVMSKVIGAIVSGIGQVFSFGGGLVGKLAGGAGDALSAAARVISPTAPSLPGVSNTSQATAYNVDAPIQITVPPGTDPGSVGPYVREGVAGGLESSLRQTSRSTIPGVAY